MICSAPSSGKKLRDPDSLPSMWRSVESDARAHLREPSARAAFSEPSDVRAEVNQAAIRSPRGKHREEVCRERGCSQTALIFFSKLHASY